MIKAVVTDIEGTTSALSFVKDVLFPYARQRIVDFIRRHQHEPAVREQILAVQTVVGRALSTEEIIVQLLQWIDEDKKVTPLKALQGMIWEDGYRCGDFTGHLYEDAARKLKEWHGRGLRLYVFSSGSVQAQRLLFGHSDYGDLTPLFDGYFDTRIGAKREAEAYFKIAAEIGIAPAQILFLSDIKEELDAARDAGYKTIWLVRDGDLLPHASHHQVRQFDDIQL